MPGTEAAAAVMPADAALVERAGSGDRAALEELFRRHGETAWRLAQAVTGEAADATAAVAEGFTRALQSTAPGTQTEFRTKVLGTTREAAVEAMRDGGRLVLAQPNRRPRGMGSADPVTSDSTPEPAVPTEPDEPERPANPAQEPEPTNPPGPTEPAQPAEPAETDEPAQPAEPAEPAADIDLTIIDLTTADIDLTAADQDAMDAAFRGLPERQRSALWLTAAEGMTAAEAAPILGLAPDVAEQLAPRAELALRVRLHERVDDDLGPALLAIALAVPAGLAAAVCARWSAWRRSALTVHPSRVSPKKRALQPWMERSLAGAAAAVFALGVIGASVFGPHGSGRTAAGEAALAPASPVRDSYAALAPVDDSFNVPPAGTSTNPTGAGHSGPDGGPVTLAGSSSTGSPYVYSPATAPAATGPSSTSASGPAVSPPTTTAPGQVNTTANVAGQGVSVGVGPCTGAAVAGVTVGCPPPTTTPTTTGVTIQIPLLPPITLP